jgi:hypothetical protein
MKAENGVEHMLAKSLHLGAAIANCVQLLLVYIRARWEAGDEQCVANRSDGRDVRLHESAGRREG